MATRFDRHGSAREDLILGMDWMRRHGIVIDLRTRTMTLTAADGSQHEVWAADPKRNGLLISAVRAARLIDQDCVGYWCYALSAESAMPSMEDVPIVRDFQDLFLAELSGLRPHRDVDFTIELDPDTRPISGAPYRMAPSKMAELKTQLEELMEKGYIRPSASP